MCIVHIFKITGRYPVNLSFPAQFGKELAEVCKTPDKATAAFMRVKSRSAVKQTMQWVLLLSTKGHSKAKIHRKVSSLNLTYLLLAQEVTQ